MSYLFNIGNKSNEDQNILWDRQNIVGVKLVCDTFFIFILPMMVSNLRVNQTSRENIENCDLVLFGKVLLSRSIWWAILVVWGHLPEGAQVGLSKEASAWNSPMTFQP